MYVSHISLQRGLSKLYLETNRNTDTNYMQVVILWLMSKSESLIVSKGTQFTGSGKLGLTDQTDQFRLQFNSLWISLET